MTFTPMNLIKGEASHSFMSILGAGGTGGWRAIRAGRETARSSKLHGRLYAVQQGGGRFVGRDRPRYSEDEAMRLMFATLLAAAIVAIAGFGGAMSPAQAQSCPQLWAERNGYYKDYGYCFRTQRAIQYFNGNGGCRYSNEGAVPFPPAIRARVNQIVRAERALGCSG
jgi:hypothetical protein